MKRKTWLALALSAVLLTAGCGGGTKTNEGTGGSSGGADPAEQKTYKVAISQYLEHASLDATREGFLAALKDNGIEEGTNLKVDYNVAQADSTNNLSIAQKLATTDSDLVLAIATPSAQAVMQQVKDKPVLFAAVTDPLDAKIVTSLEKPEGNVTGASDTNPEAIKMLMDFIAKHLPEVKSVGLVINQGEPNAIIMAKTAEEALKAHGIELVRAPVTNTSEVKQAAESLAGRVDALYITLDNVVVNGVESILQVARDNDLPLFSSDRDTVEKGAVATVGFKYFDHGYQVGEMAVEILKNGKQPSELPITKPDKLNLILNVKAAEEQGVTVTEEMKNSVQDPETNLIQ
ncbi:sugar ABC transporter substrate-binding protein [Paenibacillus sambharensis]|uniref:Sugar ABC transporter substrate-binding protein n=1 Tax=Paenibacillus sambharensis TaxID=1803190 RepID=A0A2W1LFM1_9BACL|nr:ABC transporter substrate-binding protein [Paenibacillus sambharensis]PZD97633.1 sugar ABC transporter substrate-binding protein [Paenibacillus sambharensis]